MYEEKIRPKNLSQENLIFHSMDVNQLLRKEDLFVKVNCPACQSKEYFLKFKKNKFQFVSCKKCRTLFINPRPTEKILENFYRYSKSIKHWNDKIFPVTEKERRKNIFQPRAKIVLDLCREHKVSTKKIVDVGAGFGTFCEEIKKMSVFEKVIAIEPSESLAASCRKKGIEVIEKNVERINIKNVDVVTNFELIEHLHNPKKFVRFCNKILKPNGLFFITTPNIEGFDLKILGKMSDNVNGPNHLNYFTPNSLSFLLRESGFEILELLTPGKLDVELVRRKIIDEEFSLPDNNFLNFILKNKKREYRDSFQNFLVENKISSHLWVVARKL